MPRARESAISSHIDAIVNAQIKPNEPGAAVAVVQHDKIVHSKGYGLANVEWNIPIKPDTVFRIASITKQFTAVAIMMLVEQGKLKVEDSLTKYLPDFPTSGHEVTIHHLLNHTSGIKSYTSVPDIMEMLKKDRTPPEIVDLFKEKPFDFKPGARFAYNNSGYILLGMIIEKASGMSYADFIEKNIFAPLGMKQSRYLHHDPIVPRRASGYSQNESGFINAPYISMSVPYAAGSLGSTVHDLVLWDQALRRNKLIKAKTWAKMLKPTKLNDGSTSPYGYGWDTGMYHGHRAACHSGGINGFSTNMIHFPDARTMVVVLCNRGLETEVLMLAIARQALNLTIIERQPITLDDTALEKAQGNFTVDMFPFEIVKTDGKLVMKLGRDVELLPLSATTFYEAANTETEIVFMDEQDGKFMRAVGKSALGGEFKFIRAPQAAS
jgi:CubicO group peptidase (beta-lactamase class C family)